MLISVLFLIGVLISALYVFNLIAVIANSIKMGEYYLRVHCKWTEEQVKPRDLGAMIALSIIGYLALVIGAASLLSPNPEAKELILQSDGVYAPIEE